MCGRAKLETYVSEITDRIPYTTRVSTAEFPPSWNVAPTDNLPIVRYDPSAGHPSRPIS